jgi:integrase
MASIETRLRNGSRRYVVRWREAGGAKSKSFPTKEQAKEHLAHIEGTHSPTGALTLKAWAEVWQANRVNLRASTKAKNASLMATHVLPVLGDRQLSSIGQTDVQSLVTNCAGSPATVREVYGQLSKCLSAAVSARLLRVSPCVGIILPKVEQSEMAFLDHDDVERLAKAIDKRYRALVFVLAYCGLRIGEAAALRPEDVTESLGVRTTLVEVSGVLMENSPTTKQGIRSVPMPAFVAEKITEHMKTYPANSTKSGRVFTGRDGGALRVNTFRRRHFNKAAKAAGLTLRIHDLRHTAVAFWISGGVDLLRVKTWAGHAASTFTLDRYGHLFPRDDEAILNHLNNRILFR